MDRRKHRSKASASAAARQAFKEGRGGRLEDYVVHDEDDVYDVLEEEEYEKLVESRRQREDFVVDDGAYLAVSCCCLL
jgi:DNA polymerase alpha subunit p180 N terminal